MAAEAAVLRPLGLDLLSFLGTSLGEALAREMLAFALGDVALIIVGIDSSGPHLYSVENEVVACHDFAGFASIGIGNWHANSLLMAAGHTKRRLLAETFLLVYSAKRRAEIAPGVGNGTDMFIIGPGLGQHLPELPDSLMDNLERIYNAEQERIRDAASRAAKEVTEYVEKLGTPKTTNQVVDTAAEPTGSSEEPSSTDVPGAIGGSQPSSS